MGRERMSDITKIPQQQLLNDKMASLNDIKVCKLALLHNIKEYSGERNVMDRLVDNHMIVLIIDGELERRLNE